MWHKSQVTDLAFGIAFSAISLLVSCRTQSVLPESTITPTPTPPIDRSQLAPDTQQNPFRQYAPGLLARTIYKAEPGGDFEVEIWELLIGPGKKSEAAKFPGGAVFETRAGDGVLTTAGKRREIKTGTSLSIEEGETFQIENTSPDEAVSIRMVLIRGH